MNGRLIMAILSTLLEEAALVAVVLVGLPELDISIPLAGLIALMLAWATASVFTYRMGSRALRRKPMAGIEAIIGSKGKVVSPLAPEGLIKIHGELWRAKSTGSSIDAGEEVIVLERDGGRLIVTPGQR